MDIGTIFLLVAIGVGCVDLLIMIIGPRIKDYEALSLGMAVVAGFAAIGSAIWLLLLIFNNQFQYDYVYQTTSSTSNWALKISALWTGQSGSLVFWTMLSFLLYLIYRFTIRGYEDDMVAYRASVIMIIQAILIATNTFFADPFRITSGIERVEGLGLNPLLRTFWNVIHPPIVFIGYALTMIPFAIKLAGFTIRSEDRKSESVPVLESLSRFSTILAWVMLSVGIVVGGYWAYIVLGWGGYWAWDPVETTSLVPWLLLTCYFHAKPILKNHDVLRDSFLAFAFPSVIFATWVTRSGVLNSVHLFSLSIVSWTMLATLLGIFIITAIITAWSGYRDAEPEDESEETGVRKSSFSFHNPRNVSVMIALFGLIIVLMVSVIGVALPATLNIQTVIANPDAPPEEMVSIGQDFFWIGFYVSCFLIAASAFFCMDSSFIKNRLKVIGVIVLLAIGGALGIVSFLNPTMPIPTTNWLVNAAIPIALGALIYMAVVFIRVLIGREKTAFTFRRMGRVMLHLGLLILIFGVLMSENSVYESNAMYRANDAYEVAPQIWVQVKGIDLVYWNNQRDFKLVVTVFVIEGDNVIGIGVVSIQGYPEWGSVIHTVYIHNTPFRDVFIAVNGFTQVAPNVMAVSLHTKVLPFMAFVWTGSFFLISSMLPMAAIEGSRFIKNLREKYQDEHQEEETEDVEASE